MPGRRGPAAGGKIVSSGSPGTSASPTHKSHSRRPPDRSATLDSQPLRDRLYPGFRDVYKLCIFANVYEYGGRAIPPMRASAEPRDDTPCKDDEDSPVVPGQECGEYEVSRLCPKYLILC